MTANGRSALAAVVERVEMVTASLPLRLCLGLCLLAAACSGNEAETPEPGLPQADALPTHQSDESDSDSTAVDTAIAATAENGGAAISVDVIGAMFPTSSGDADSLIDLYSVFGRVRYLRYMECMQDAGFEIDALEAEPDGFHNRFYDYPDLEAIAEQGFGVTFGSSYEVDPIESVPQGLRDQFREDRSACNAAYDDPSDQIWDASSALSSLWSSELRAIESSAEMVEQFEVWAQCMTDGGRPVESHEGFFPDLDAILIELLEADELEAARAEELAAAELYVARMTPLEAVRQPMRDQARREFLENNAEEVRAIEELAKRLILEVQQQ